MTRVTDRGAHPTVDDVAVEQARLDSEEHFQAVIGGLRTGLLLRDRELRLVWFNDASCEMFGYSREEFAELTFRDILLDDDLPNAARLFEDAMEGRPSAGEHRHRARRKSGEVIEIDVTAAPFERDGEVIGVLAELRDVSQELRLRRQLESTTAEMTSILETAPDPIIVIDERGAIVQANAAMVHVFGWELSELAGRSVAMLAGGDLTGEQHDRYVAHFIETGEASTEEGLVLSSIREVVGRRKDGSEFPMELTCTEVASSGGPRNFIGVVRDVSDRVAAYEALRESEQHYRTLVETVQDGIVVLDAKGRAILFNEALCGMLGYTRKEMQDMPLTDVLLADDRDEAYERIARHARGEIAPGRYQLRLVRKDGEVIVTEISAAQFAQSGGVVGSLVLVRDVTEDVRMREQVLQSQKLEAVGTLVAGVAHDFNNLLTVIDGSIEVAQDEGADSPWLERARVAAHRAAGLVQQLLLASRPGEATCVEVDLVELARETVGLVRETSDRRIDIQLDMPQERVCVWADGGQLHQVLMNLFVNACAAVREAMEQQEDGSPEYQPRITLTLTSGEQHLGSEPESWAELILRDNGAGMPPEVRARIFDPFFTTKGVDGGTGLGLFTAYGIVNEHGGSISVESAPGEGAVFTIRLPIVPVATDGEASRAGETVEAAGPGRGKRVLVVDDEPVVIELAHRALARAGYHVTSATGGDGALRLVSEQPFDLVLLDVNMPAPNGWQTLHAMLGDDPEQLVLMLSGFALDEEARERGARGLLRKPFNRNALLSAVNGVLSDGSG
jgi:PAS domain S-box-containing protein